MLPIPQNDYAFPWWLNHVLDQYGVTALTNHLLSLFRVMRSDTRMEMHRVFSKKRISEESKHIMGSPWTLPRAGKDCGV